jgi:macrolide-specific efflux system membrane fusion protein
MRSPLRRRTLVVNGTLGVLLAGGIGAAYLSLADDGAGASTSTRVTRVMRGTVAETVSASGSVTSGRTRSLSFGASGTVTKIHVKAGEKVSEGETLALLDQTEALENLAAAKAGNTDTAQGAAS